MKRLLIIFVMIIVSLCFFEAGKAMAQGRAKSSAKNSWAGVWSYSSRFTPGTLTIKMLSANRFSFEIEALNGANTGDISGVAKITGTKAVFNDKLSTEKDAQKFGCVITFTNKGTLIDVKTSAECSNYGGNGVNFGGVYRKGKAREPKETFVTLEVFPNAKIEAKFKTLVGIKEYRQFLDDFQLISEDQDLDNLRAKVFSACVRGICPYNAGIIMYDANDNIWAAVMNIDDPKKSLVHYYTNASEWKDKLPKTIEEWTKEKSEMNENLTVVYKSRH